MPTVQNNIGTTTRIWFRLKELAADTTHVSWVQWTANDSNQFIGQCLHPGLPVTQKLCVKTRQGRPAQAQHSSHPSASAHRETKVGLVGATVNNCLVAPTRLHVNCNQVLGARLSHNSRRRHILFSARVRHVLSCNSRRPAVHQQPKRSSWLARSWS